MMGEQHFNKKSLSFDGMCLVLFSSPLSVYTSRLPIHSKLNEHLKQVTHTRTMLVSVRYSLVLTILFAIVILRTDGRHDSAHRSDD
jgi:hypothetical protein